MDEGFDFHWYAGKSPYFVTPEGKKLYCKLRSCNWRERLSKPSSSNRSQTPEQQRAKMMKLNRVRSLTRESSQRSARTRRWVSTQAQLPSKARVGFAPKVSSDAGRPSSQSLPRTGFKVSQAPHQDDLGLRKEVDRG